MLSENKIIYLADDEVNIRNLLYKFLCKEGYQVEAFEDGEKLYDRFLEKPADLVILDVMMPGADGFEICNKIRLISNVPIIFLTAKDTEHDYICGITLGGDDYFVKPIRPTILIMRIKAIFRRIKMDCQSEKAENDCLAFGNVSLNAKKMSAQIDGNNLALTNTEFRLLQYMFENCDKALSREELLNKIWGYDSYIETRATDDTIKRIRKKLAKLNSSIIIQTVWGYGFLLKEKDNEL